MEKKVYSVDGKELRTITLDDKVFGLPVNEDVIYYAITNELANKRVGTACTKDRSEVHGSNAKPYKQKGTGRARRGDKKSPLVRGGGVVFGPKPRDFSFRLPKKVKRLAMKSILSMKAQNGRTGDQHGFGGLDALLLAFSVGVEILVTMGTSHREEGLPGDL